ncbi:MAG: STAS domain-containing protein [Planctomycetes bacterium]|nr:STAS domain-containing protein [Planctomycetota bacterium]MCW8137007.1 STAS domain-containing protein [Planctomycetota bacterium]
MAGYLEAASTSDAVYVRVVGLGNFNNAGPMREYAEKAFNDGVRCVIVDLAECTGLDSTFMGTLMGFIGYDTDKSPNPLPVTVTVVNATPPTMRAMNSLGLPKILHVRPDPVDFPTCRLERLREGWQDRRRRTLLIRDAHVALMKADRENEARFGPFVAALVKETRDMLDCGD